MLAGHTRGSYTVANERSTLTSKKLDEAMDKILRTKGPIPKIKSTTREPGQFYNGYISSGLGITITTSEFAVTRERCFIPRPLTFSEWWWASLSYCPVTPVKMHEYVKPAIYMRGMEVLCHPSLLQPLRKALESNKPVHRAARDIEVMPEAYRVGKIDNSLAAIISRTTLWRNIRTYYMVSRNRHKDKILQKLRGFASEILAYVKTG